LFVLVYTKRVLRVADDNMDIVPGTHTAKKPYTHPHPHTQIHTYIHSMTSVTIPETITSTIKQSTSHTGTTNESKFSIRSATRHDADAMYHVCLKTGDSGDDGTHLYKDPSILGKRWVGPYVYLQSDLAFVLEDSEGVCGYVLAALYTPAFYKRVRDEWLPDMQKEYKRPDSKHRQNWNHDEQVAESFYDADAALQFLDEWDQLYPSHLHIDLLPRAQGVGNGTHMMHHLLSELKAKGSKGVYLEMAPDNTRAFKFYTKLGFKTIRQNEHELFLGRSLVESSSHDAEANC
jgi:ribosomal protein S18 acetylase RimI-like enzyme